MAALATAAEKGEVIVTSLDSGAVLREKYVHHKEEQRITVALPGDYSVESVRLVIKVGADEEVAPIRCHELLVDVEDTRGTPKYFQRSRRTFRITVSHLRTWWIETVRDDTPFRRVAGLEIIGLPADAVVMSIHVASRESPAYVYPVSTGETDDKGWRPVKNKHAAAGGEYHYGGTGRWIRFKFPAVKGRGDLKTVWLTFSFSSSFASRRFARETRGYVVYATGRPPFEVDADDVDIVEGIGAETVAVKLKFSNTLCMDVAALESIEVPPAKAGMLLETVEVDFYADFIMDPPPPPPVPPPPSTLTPLVGEEKQQRQQRHRRILYDLRGGSTDGTVFYRAPDGTVAFSSVPTAAGTTLGGMFDGSGCYFWRPPKTNDKDDDIIRITVAFPRPIRIAAMDMAPDSTRAGKGISAVEVRLGAANITSPPVIVFSPADNPRCILVFGPAPVEASEITMVITSIPAGPHYWSAVSGISFYTEPVFS